jgi:hypothetical protein
VGGYYLSPEMALAKNMPTLSGDFISNNGLFSDTRISCSEYGTLGTSGLPDLGIDHGAYREIN